MNEEPTQLNDQTKDKRRFTWALFFAGLPFALMMITVFGLRWIVGPVLLIIPGGFLWTMSIFSVVVSTFLFLSLWTRRAFLFAAAILILNGVVLWFFARELIFPYSGGF